MSEYLFKNMDSYDTPENLPVSLAYKLMFCSRWYFYLKNFGIFIAAGKLGKQGKLDGDAQIAQSSGNVKLIENIGGHLHIRGLNHLRDLNGEPVVIIGNHMSLLETAMMHALIREHLDFSFVVKESLYDIPVFKYILSSMNAIAVTRTNPREDLKKVLSEGKKMLSMGRSMIVFPQSTRSATFDPAQFNSIGIKLAKSAGVRVVPLALKTDMLGIGKLCRDLGPVYPHKDVWFEFGAPLTIEGNGQQQQQQVIEFISTCLERWNNQEGSKL
ncbi:MAG: 1-acyl-sn-glycerol-3-phosphate acyltransferase [Lentisphaeria bacterium]|nr:1-acyl-sn-glycerol-3-phosphate acyltransferase [Lentisphaeria bacterium]